VEPMKGEPSTKNPQRIRSQRVRVRVRRKRPPSWLERVLGQTLREILSSIAGIPAALRRQPLLLLGIGGGGLWLAWPSIAPLFISGRSAASRPPMEVISVFVEDPQRTVMAIRLWKDKPGSLLVLQGRPSSQEVNIRQLMQRGELPSDARRIISLEPGCDTVGQVDALARLLEPMNRRGNLTMVTSPAHLSRTLAIARIVIGPMGWTVAGQAAVTGDNRPEGAWRTWRDEARAHVLRLTGLTGSQADSTCD
jgi:hypothetical protein